MTSLLKLIIAFLFIFFSVQHINAQRVIETESGQKIVLLPNGSWEYAKEKSAALTSSAALYNLPTNENSTNTELVQPEEALLNKQILDKLTVLKKQEVESSIRLFQLVTNIKVLKEEIKLYDDEVALAQNYTLEELNEELERAEKQRKKASKKSKQIGKDLKLMDELVFLDYEDRKLKYQLYLDENNPKVETKTVTLFEEMDPKLVRAYYNNPTVERLKCNVVFEGVDESSRKRKKELGKEFLFGYTHPKLADHYKQDDYLVCYANLTELGGYRYLILNFTIKSKDAAKNYGQIEAGSILRIAFIDGTEANLFCSSNTKGNIEKYTGSTKYQAIYQLGRSDIKDLEKKEIDQLGLMWTTGYETYDIYEIDLLKNQFKCLNQK